MAREQAQGWGIGAAIVLLIVLSGCELKPGAQSVFEAFAGAKPTPLELSLMASNKYDANARYVGTLGLAQENYAGEPVYIALFEANLKDTDPMVRAAAIR